MPPIRAMCSTSKREKIPRKKIFEKIKKFCHNVISEIFYCVIIYADKDISFGDRDCNSTKRKPIAAFPEENIDQKHEDREIQDR